jgi:hypothetical protein
MENLIWREFWRLFGMMRRMISIGRREEYRSSPDFAKRI